MFNQDPKIFLEIDKDGNLQISEEQAKLLGLYESEINWKAIRLNDNLTKQSKEVSWIEWNEDGTFKDRHTEPDLGRSLLMYSSNFSDYWLTTIVKEILEVKENFIKFNTKNSTYELHKII